MNHMGNEFMTSDENAIADIEHALRTARENGQSVRLVVDFAGVLKIKTGGGIWSPGIESENR